jgi:osmoprotectant transport system ATP-binding protein
MHQIIELDNVRYDYTKGLTLHFPSVKFEQKKITAIIGRSGSGKSTMLQLINGLIKPVSGQVRAFNRPLNYANLQPVRLQMGYMVQGSGLFPHITVASNILMPGVISKGRNNTRRLDEVMALVGLPPAFKAKFPYELSGGEQQRVGICRALFLDPPILLMDEPFGALDPVTRAEIHVEVLRLQQVTPRTILFVTHDLREAKMLSEKILVLDKGEVQQYDSVENVMSSPATPSVQKLIESSVW